jgi:hypothetical protein
MSNRRLRYEDDYEEDDFERKEPGDTRDRRWSEVRTGAQEAVRRAGARGNPPRGARNKRGGGGFRFSDLADRPAVLIAAIVAGVAVLGLVGYLLFSGGSRPSSPTAAPQQSAERTGSPATDSTAQPAQSPRPATSSDPITQITQPPPAQTTTENWLEAVARITLRMALAALLAALLAFRPRKDLPVLQRNPYVAQSQILLAVVAAALMMIVADNAARAFGIFAAASLVRFRTTLRDPKDITILLVSLGIGLAAGVGRLELAIVLSLFVLLMLWVLEFYEPAQVFRALELTVKTRSIDDTDEVLKDLFDKYDIKAEVREIDRQDAEDPVGKIVYFINLTSSVSPDRLSDEIFTADPDNVDSIEWDQKKSTSYIYR